MIRALSLTLLALTTIACAPPTVEATEHHRSSESHEAKADAAFEGTDILVIAGQSNGVGQGTGEYGDDPALLAQDAKIFQIGRRGALDKTIIPAQDPLEFWVIPATWPFKGFGMPLARRYAKDVLAPGRRLLLVPAAQGATVIDQWDPAQKRLLYTDMKERIDLALAQPGDNKLVGVIWQQGESDVLQLAGGDQTYDAKTYANRVVALAGALRADFASQGCFPFLVGEMPREWMQNAVIPAETLVATKTAVTNAVSAALPSIGCSSFVSSDGLTSSAGDPIHFSAAGQAALGSRYAELLGAGPVAARSVQRSALLSSVYGGIFGAPPAADVLSFWTDRYAPTEGIGGRAIAEAFLLASPNRAGAEAATTADDPALTAYIEAAYAGLLPGHVDNTATIAGWYAQGLLTIDQLDAMFLDDAQFRDRCAVAGVGF